ncbi:hypothetical protein Nepgr_018234 [Nepenthes gracilis]|uniref:Uncharacterized protein n=1 Tax=Nepenthes gracilis TaxID=150966 RepID=A0AAD3XT96_NEPGR|nr:hypothetical protein Nepgr_018234 [Nepenthes gracilis]
MCPQGFSVPNFSASQPSFPLSKKHSPDLLIFASAVASILTEKSFVLTEREFRGGGGGQGLLFDCQEEMNNSKDWEPGVYYILCACYAVVSVAALVWHYVSL